MLLLLRLLRLLLCILLLPVSSSGITTCDIQTEVGAVGGCSCCCFFGDSCNNSSSCSFPVVSNSTISLPTSTILFFSVSNCCYCCGCYFAQCYRSQSNLLRLRAVTHIWPRPLPSVVSQFAVKSRAFASVVKESWRARGVLASARKILVCFPQSDLRFGGTSCRNLVNGPETITETTLDIFLEFALLASSAYSSCILAR